MSDTECPSCGSEFDADDAAVDGDIAVCPECGEVVPLDDCEE